MYEATVLNGLFCHIKMYSEEELVNRCLKQEAKAQEEFYRRFAPKMYGVCLRFAKNQMEADDVLQEGFIKVFISLKTFRNEGSLEGWIRRTIVNTAINIYKKNVKYQKDIEIDKAEVIQNENPGPVDNLSVEELLKLITELPTGYKMVFNLNVIEGYTHKEISKLLDISENTSKSQLSRARQTLQKKIAELSGNTI
ncbi:MAG: RNA polymerase sigma factor [Bacteroidales bacterium]|nr:RNA polymerase sigma factor [Bacteroidales bacterium]